LKGNSQCIP